MNGCILIAEILSHTLQGNNFPRDNSTIHTSAWGTCSSFFFLYEFNWLQTYILAEMSKKYGPLCLGLYPMFQVLPIKKLLLARTSNKEVTQSSFQRTHHNLKCEIGRNLLGFAMWVRSPTTFKKSPLRTTFPSAQYRAPGSITLFTSGRTSTAPPCGTAPGLAPCGSLISVGPEICKLLTLSIRDIVYVTHLCCVSRSVGQSMLWPGKEQMEFSQKPLQYLRCQVGLEVVGYEKGMIWHPGSVLHTHSWSSRDESRSNSEETSSSPGDDNHRAQSRRKSTIDQSAIGLTLD